MDLNNEPIRAIWDRMTLFISKTTYIWNLGESFTDYLIKGENYRKITADNNIKILQSYPLLISTEYYRQTNNNP